MLPGELTWDNPAWDGALQALVRDAAAALGVAGPVTAALHNLLLYRLGGHFAAHADTESGACMFATLVVTLPSVFTGRRLVVRHNGEEETFAGYADRSEVPTAPYWGAYYSDCEHEVTPVTSGHRVVLVYNLTRPPADRDSDGDPANDAEGVLSTPPVRKYGALGSAAHAMAAFASHWRSLLQRPVRSHRTPAALLYLLDHKYTADGVGWGRLKGKDALLAAALRATPATRGGDGDASTAGGSGGGAAFRMYLVAAHVYEELGPGHKPSVWGYEAPPDGGRWEDAGVRLEAGPADLQWRHNGAPNSDGVAADAAATAATAAVDDDDDDDDGALTRELTTILTLRGWLGAPGQANSDSDDDASRPAAADLGPPSWVRGTAAVRALTPEGMEMVPSGNDGDLPTRWYRTYGLVVALAGAPNRADPTYGWYFVRGREEREYGDTAQWSGPGHTAWTTVVRK